MSSNHTPGSGHTIHRHCHHHGWDNSFAPALTIAPGETVEFETVDSSGGQLGPDSTLADLARMDFGKVNPVTGPVWIDGAEPGDALKVTLVDFKPSGWGWTANIPGFGLLADQFTEGALHIWKYDAAAMTPALYGPGGRVPLKPFAGTIGLAPAESGLHSVVPPRRVGGNMDVRDLCAGTELYLPVEVAGALFSVGDTHAAQGDGEVCGTAIESPMDVTLKFELVKGRQPPVPPLHHTRAGDPAPRRGRIRGDDGRRPRPDGRGARRRLRHDRPAHIPPRHVRRGSLYAVQRLRRPAGQRDRGHAELGGQLLLPARGAVLTLRPDVYQNGESGK